MDTSAQGDWTAPNLTTANAALARLLEGNRRFVAGANRRLRLGPGADARGEPMAVVLACADSAVPCEALFDCEASELFVVSIAGNVVAPSVLGSVSFALARHRCELVVVLGHTPCASLDAVLDALDAGHTSRLSQLREIAGRLGSNLEHGAQRRPRDRSLVCAATRANVAASVRELRGSLEEFRAAGRNLVVVGAEHAMESGEVRFLNGLDG